MARPHVIPTGIERQFGDEEIIVSKTDTKGIITYANRVFERVSGYSQHELLGQPHNLIRHPDMPRCVFALLWSQIMSGGEIFAYVVNMSRNGDHYWVFAHVTPSFDDAGKIVGYHSNRRVPERKAVDAVIPIYKALCAKEAAGLDPHAGMIAAAELLKTVLEGQKVCYDEFVFSL